MKKSVFLLLASVAAASAGSFTTGQAARAVIGQSTFAAQDEKPSQIVLSAVSGLAYGANRLFVTGANRVSAQPQSHRVLIYNNLRSQVPSPTAILPQGERCPACVGSANVVLGQTDFLKHDNALNRAGLRLPTAVATDGVMVAVADTDNNRVLIWRSIPTVNNQEADVVLGQSDFTSARVSLSGDVRVPTATSLRGPQGVWIQNGMIFVADTQNHRVLIWRSIPTQNGQPADVVLGQPGFDTVVNPDLTQNRVEPSAGNMLNPVSVTSDGVRLFVSDLGHNRVLIWNSIPTSNQQPANVVVGQPDFNTGVANYGTRIEGDKRVKVLCDPVGKDSQDNDLFPILCGSTLNFPRYALSDGTRLFIADGGNDRVLVFNQIPSLNGQKADVVLGQPIDTVNLSSDNAFPLSRAATDTVRTPLSLAWDGENLYVADPFNRRVVIYSEGDYPIPYAGVRNSGSWLVYAVGSISFSGKVEKDQEIAIKIADKEYKYKTVEGDTFEGLVVKLAELINTGAGDPKVFASANTVTATVILTARAQGEEGNSVEYSLTLTPQNATLLGATGGPTLSGGMDAAKIAPGTLVSIVGENMMTGAPVSAAPNAEELPRELGGVRVYFDGIAAPLMYVSPTQINAQVPFEMKDTSSMTAWVRFETPEGVVRTSAPRGVSIIAANPGIFAAGGTDPRPAVAYHGSLVATASILLSGAAKAGDTATVVINGREYAYTVVTDDTLNIIRDKLVALINQDPEVEARSAGQFQRIVLYARQAGEAGNNIKLETRVSTNSEVGLSASNATLCCASDAVGLITEDNPAKPGELIIVYATGLGMVEPAEARQFQITGQVYRGPVVNAPIADQFVSALAGGKTANVLFTGMKPGTFLYEIVLELNRDLPTNPRTQLTIAQEWQVSNIVTIPVFNPNSDPIEVPN
jgi:uncharacterized protein (TIGR03437 family)